MQKLVEVIQTVGQQWQIFATNVYPMIFAICAGFLLLYVYKKQRNYVYLGVAVLLVYFNPFIANNMMTFWCESQDYKEVLLLIPAVLLTACAITELLDSKRGKKRAILCLVLFLLFQVAVNLAYTTDHLTVRISGTKIEPEVAQIADMLHDNSIEAKVLAPDEVAAQLREYSLAASVYYGAGYQYDASDVKGILKVAKKNKWNIIVMEKKEEDQEQLEQKNYYPCFETDHYRVYVNL